MTNEDESAPPQLFNHCVRTYRAMMEEAKRIPTNIEEPVTPGTKTDSNLDLSKADHIIVYEGFFTSLITQKLNLSTPYYTSVKNTLIRMGCISQLRRGGSTTPSQWELHWEPSLEAYMKTRGKKVETPSRAKDAEAQLRQQNNDLSKRVAALEKWQNDVNKTLIRKLGTEEVNA